VANSRIVEEISKQGKAFAVGTDVFPAPSNVQKMASQLGARVISPSKSLLHTEKTKLVDAFLKSKEERIPIRNRHEKDALAAAIFALKQMNTLIKKTDDYLRQHHLERFGKEVKERVLVDRIAIVKAVRELKGKGI
jgi:predicted RNase H-like nuclease (RuvC/YqgF family)